MGNGYFMRRAMELAEKSSRVEGLWPQYVGALVVKDDEIVGEGYKRFFSEERIMVLHAERDALYNAGMDRSRGATLYTTLQPCTPTYKTVFSPCSEFIVEYGISRVVIGLNPRMGLGTWGIKFMQENGIEVVLFDDFQDKLDALRTGKQYAAA